MQTIKFSKNKNFTTEMHNLEQSTFSNVKIFEKDLCLYSPCNLNIFITCICNNSCDFCINKDNNRDLVTDKEYIQFLPKIFEEIQNKNIEITITGGEPTLSPYRLVETMKLCKQYNFKCRTFSTTGYGLFSEYKGKPICQHMIENNFINNINISKMHYCQDLNKKIMGNNSLSDNDIKNISTFFKINSASLRISCNLIKGYIDNLSKILKFVDYYYKLNIDTVMFREIVGNTKDVLINDIIKEIKNNSDFVYIKTLNGIFYNVDIFSYKDNIVKIYTDKEIDKKIVPSLSIRNNVFRIGFNGQILKEDCNDKSRK